MKKDKEWLKEALMGLTFSINEIGKVRLREVFELVDQLDEPEVLSQKWVDENVVEGDFRGGQQFWYGRFIEEEKVRNLLVPKQDKPVEAVKEYFKSVEKAKEVLEELGYVVSEKPTKPVVPQFVADYIEYHKRTGLALGEWFTFDYDNEKEDEIAKWLYDNNYGENTKREYLLIDAIRYGYEVEKEKRYYIINKENNATLMTFELSDVVGEEIIEFVYAYSENETIHFDSKEKAELIAHFVGDFVEVEEVTE